MVLSEKEIKNAIKFTIKESKGESKFVKSIYELIEATLKWTLRGEPRYTLKEAEEKGLILPLHDLKKGVEYRKRLLKLINKEPRYSISELEKIFDSDEYTRFWADSSSYPLGLFSEFINFLKDKKKVEEILNADKH